MPQSASVSAKIAFTPLVSCVSKRSEPKRRSESVTNLRPRTSKAVFVSCYDCGAAIRLSEMPNNPKQGCPRCGGKVRINSPRPKVENR